MSDEPTCVTTPAIWTLPRIGLRRRMFRRRVSDGLIVEEWMERVVRFEGDKPVWERES